MTDTTQYSASHDQVRQEYRVKLEQGFEAVVHYEKQGNVLVLDHSMVPSELRGKGYGGVMVEAALTQIEAEGFKVKPTCSYIVHYIDRHERWQGLLAD